MRQVIICPGEDGYWVAECPGLPGCLSQGKTKQEAIVNIMSKFAENIRRAGSGVDEFVRLL